MSTPSKTLVIRFSSIGDIVLSTPLLRVLRATFPKIQLDYVTRTEYAELVRHNQNVNLVYEYDVREGFEGLRRLKQKLRDEAYDTVVDIHGSLRSIFLRTGLGAQRVFTIDKRKYERFMLVHLKKNLYRSIVSVADRYIEPLEAIGVRSDGKGPELHIPDEVLFGVSGKMATLQLHRFERTIGLCPTARHFTKRWPDDRFVALGVRFAREEDGKVLIFGGKDDRNLTSTIAARINAEAGAERATDLSGQFSLLETAAAMEYCDVVVTNDSGLMHIASAMHKKLVAVFGSTVREFGFFPYGGIVVERTGLGCRPCSHIGRPSCPEGHLRCLKEIDVEEVYQRVHQLVHQEIPERQHLGRGS
jgi:lipopolysaccharide heptosyltransferase II